MEERGYTIGIQYSCAVFAVSVAICGKRAPPPAARPRSLWLTPALFHDRTVVINDPYASLLWSFCAFSELRSSSQPRVLSSVPRRFGVVPFSPIVALLVYC